MNKGLEFILKVVYKQIHENLTKTNSESLFWMKRKKLDNRGSYMMETMLNLTSPRGVIAMMLSPTPLPSRETPSGELHDTFPFNELASIELTSWNI